MNEKRYGRVDKKGSQFTDIAMYGLALNHAGIAIISLPQGEIRFIDKTIPLLHNNHNQRHICSLWPKDQQASLQTLFVSHQNDSVPSTQDIDNSLLNLTFRVTPILNKNRLCAYFWSIKTAPSNDVKPVNHTDRLFEQASTPQWFVNTGKIKAYLQHLSIHSMADIRHYAQSQVDFIPSVKNLMDIDCANAALYDYLGYNSNPTDFHAFFKNNLDDDAICHYCHALVAIKSSKPRYLYDGAITRCHHKKHCMSIELITAQSGQTLHVTAIELADIQHNDKLNLEERLLSALLNPVSGFLIIYDCITNALVFHSNAIFKLSGKSFPSVLTTDNPFIKHIANPDQLTEQIETDAMQAAFKQGKAYTFNAKLCDKNNQWRYLHCQCTIFDHDEAGNIHHAVINAQDATRVLQAQQTRSSQEERHALLAENFSDLIITLNKDFVIDYVSRSSQKLLGYEGRDLLSRTEVFSILGLDKHEKILRHKLNQAIKDESSRQATFPDLHEILETSCHKADGSRLPLEVRVSLIKNNDRIIEGLLIAGQDITERCQVETNKHLASQVFESSLDAIYITNKAGLIVQVNPSFITITGYQYEDVLGQKPTVLKSGWHDISFETDIKPTLYKEKYWEGELLSRRADGEAFLAQLRITALYDKTSQFLGLITSFKDITEAKNSEDDIRRLAYFDPLTELPNRALFADRLNQALQRGSRNRLYVAVLFLDLDGFKAVNDKLGHANGDRLLTEVGKRLKHTIRSDDTVARMGGDEFSLILNALPTREMAETATAQIAEKIVLALSKPFIIDSNPVNISCSIGIALYPDDSISPDELLKQSDTAMYHAKHSGKNGFQFYTSDMSERTRQRQELETYLQAASFDDELTLLYQPRFDLQQLTLTGFETRIRWSHPIRGVIKPAIFLPMAEDLGLGSTLGHWLIDNACKGLAEWHQSGNKNHQVSVAVFERHYIEGGLVKSIKQSLQRYQIPAQCLTIEITQEILMNDIGFAYGVLSDLKALGVRISVNHFASSLVSLQYFNRLPIDEIKINHPFIQNLDQNTDDIRLVNGIIAIAINFNYDLIIEGIETNVQLALLSDRQWPSHLHIAFSQLTPADNLIHYNNLHQAQLE